MTYNNRREVFPASFVANSFSFAPAQLLQVEDAPVREVPKVSFG
jgi:LemA protein